MGEVVGKIERKFEVACANCRHNVMSANSRTTLLTYLNQSHWEYDEDQWYCDECIGWRTIEVRKSSAAYKKFKRGKYARSYER